MLILGLALGAELDLVTYLTSRCFGLESFGFLFGTIAGLITPAGSLMPLLMSMVFDETGSYAAVMWAYVPACLASAALFLSLGPYPARPRSA